MNTYFISDTHFYHTMLVKKGARKFSCVDEMNETIIKNWNSVVGKSDLVYHLGDLGWFKSQEMVDNILSRLNGQVFLIRGNHDRRKFLDHKKIVAVKDYKKIRINDRKIILMHYPLLVWDCSHWGAWHLHGHCHGSLQPCETALRMDVGVEANNYTPVSFEQVESFMCTKKFKPIDRHK